MSRRIIHVVADVAHYDNPQERTGLRLSALTHAWITSRHRASPQRMALLAETKPRKRSILPSSTTIYFTGGRAVMWDFSLI